MMSTNEEIPVIRNLLDQRELVGETRGKIMGIRDAILSTLSINFSPALAAKAYEVIAPIENYQALRRLHRQLLKARDEQIARIVLDLPDEQSVVDSEPHPQFS